MYMMNEDQRARLDEINAIYKNAPDYPMNLIEGIFMERGKKIGIIDPEKLHELIREIEEDVLGTIQGAVYQCLFIENRGLYETAGYLSISAEWVNSLSGEILRKLRNPKRSRPIRDCIKF